MRKTFPHIVQLDKRTALFGKNIIASFLIKGWGALVQLLLVPLTLQHLTTYEYGLWLTINSLLLWIDTMDLGLGNGLRNRLTEALAKQDLSLCGRLVSTTLVMLIMIVVPFVLILCVCVYSLDCHRFLNIDPLLVPNLPTILIGATAFVGMTFVLKFISNIYLALQLPAVSNALVIGGQTLAFLIILFCTQFFTLSLLHIALIYTVSPFVVYVLAYPLTFSRYPFLRPSIKLFDRKEIAPLFALSIRFFVLHFAGMMIFATSNIIITRVISADAVTPFQIAYRYFALTNMLFTIISAPLWSATTDAYTREDYLWIRTILKRMRWVLGGFYTCLALMVLVAPWIYRLWVGDEIDIPFSLSSWMAIYMVIILYGTCYSNIICGIGKIKLLTIITIIEAMVFIPLAVFLGHQLGVIGVLYALISVNSLSAIVNRLQCHHLLHQTATGLWNQ